MQTKDGQSIIMIGNELDRLDFILTAADTAGEGRDGA